ncbi:hypothetical protein E3N88_36745 [Mikania micrantha]|uniref:Uncharacterized protein n=1 Tax=Mikania micrantha TaxID=192012 RepID=A0A5N6M4N0_9ASTR|nr:hypothetical protein E3N88_36745 [Mikania micrantha]
MYRTCNGVWAYTDPSTRNQIYPRTSPYAFLWPYVPHKYEEDAVISAHRHGWCHVIDAAMTCLRSPPQVGTCSDRRRTDLANEVVSIIFGGVLLLPVIEKSWNAVEMSSSGVYFVVATEWSGLEALCRVHRSTSRRRPIRPPVKRLKPSVLFLRGSPMSAALIV